MKRPRPVLLCASVLALLVLAGAAPPASAAESNGNGQTTSHAFQTPPPEPLPKFDPAVKFVEGWTCDLFGPAEVQGYRVVCPNGTFLDFYVSDGFIRGDHWELKGKSWDLFPNSAVTTAPGPVIQYGVPGRVYNYGGPSPLDAYVECTYIHGINIFGASSFLIFASDAAACTVTPDPIRSRINRTP
jgi:hypothetical protein